MTFPSMMQHQQGPLHRPTSLSSSNPPALRYPVLPVGRSIEFSPDTVIEEAKMTNAEDEASASAYQDLSDSQYELVTESSILSDNESRNDEGESVTSFDDYVLDDASSLTGTDLSAAQDEPQSELHVDPAPEVASGLLDASALDSAATSRTVAAASSSTVELKIPYPSTRTNSSDAVPVQAEDKMPGWAVKYGISPAALELKEPFRVAYCGNEKLREVILNKLARAVGVSLGVEIEQVMHFFTGPASMDSLVKLKADGQSSSDSDDTPTSHLRKVLEVRLFSPDNQDHLSKFDRDLVCFAQGDSELQQFDFDTRNKDREQLLDKLGDTAMMDIAATPCLPMTVHYQHPTIGGLRMQTQDATAVATKFFRLPVDVDRFSSISDADLNRHLAYLVEPKRAAKKGLPQQIHGWAGFLNGMVTGFNENFRGRKTRAASTLSLAEQLGLNVYYVFLVVAMLLGWAYVGTFVASKITGFIPMDIAPPVDLVANATAIPAYTATTAPNADGTGHASLFTSSYSNAVSTRPADTSVAVFAPFTPSGPDSWPAGLQVKVLQANGGKTYLFMGKALQKSKASRDVLVKVTSGGAQLNASLSPVNETFYELDFGMPNQTYGVVDVSVWKEGAPQVTWKLKDHHKSQSLKDISKHIIEFSSAIFGVSLSQSKAVGEAFLKQIGGRVDVIVRESAVSLRSTQNSLQKYYANAIQYYGKQSKSWGSNVQEQFKQIPAQMDQAVTQLRKETGKLQTAVGTYLADQQQQFTQRLRVLRRQAQESKGLGLPNTNILSNLGNPLKMAQKRAKSFYKKERSPEELTESARYPAAPIEEYGELQRNPEKTTCARGTLNGGKKSGHKSCGKGGKWFCGKKSEVIYHYEF